MSKKVKTSAGGSKRKEKAPAQSSIPPEEETLFQSPNEYAAFLQISNRKIEPLRCFYDKLLESTHLPQLLAKYRLEKFLTYKGVTYPRLVKMFYANLATADDKLSCYVMHKHIVIDTELFANEFGMDGSPAKLTAGFFPNYNRAEAIKMLFPYSVPKDTSGKLLITGLSPEDRILHYAICKVILPRITNFTQIVEDELFLMWIIKNQFDFNFPYFILKYLAECAKRTDIGFLPFGMILTPFFTKFKIKVSDETQSLPVNSTTMFTASHLHKMGLEQDDNGTWKRKRVQTFQPFTTTGATSSGGVSAPSPDFEANILQEMRNMHGVILSRLDSQQELLDSIDDRLGHMELENRRQYNRFYERFTSIDTQLHELSQTIQQRDEEAEFQGMDFQHDPPAP